LLGGENQRRGGDHRKIVHGLGSGERNIIGTVAASSEKRNKLKKKLAKKKGQRLRNGRWEGVRGVLQRRRDFKLKKQSSNRKGTYPPKKTGRLSKKKSREVLITTERES